VCPTRKLKLGERWKFKFKSIELNSSVSVHTHTHTHTHRERNCSAYVSRSVVIGKFKVRMLELCEVWVMATDCIMYLRLSFDFTRSAPQTNTELEIDLHSH